MNISEYVKSNDFSYNTEVLLCYLYETSECKSEEEFVDNIIELAPFPVKDNMFDNIRIKTNDFQKTYFIGVADDIYEQYDEFIDDMYQELLYAVDANVKKYCNFDSLLSFIRNYSNELIEQLNMDYSFEDFIDIKVLDYSYNYKGDYYLIGC